MQKKNELHTHLTLYAKINSRWIIILTVKPKIIKHLEVNPGENLYVSWLHKDCWDRIPKIMNKLYFTKIKNFCSSKDTIKDKTQTRRKCGTHLSKNFLKNDLNKCLWECGETGTLMHYRWECKMAQVLWKYLAIS